ncbi:MAG TPA: hypothetical protein VNA17_02760 [Pyrinomonadaceae bacterium]|nr:hypothetical protein [Pyrinomonadaceae bacterium]
MKFLIGTFLIASMIASSATFASAQDATAPEAKARVIAELAAARPNSVVKNQPFSADEINESTQTLADGNRIVRSTTTKMYRNSEGRVRREIPGGKGGMLGSTYSMSGGVSIFDPAGGQKYLLDSKLKTAQVMELKSGQNVTIASSLLSDADRAKIEQANRASGMAKGEAERAMAQRAVTITQADQARIEQLQEKLKAMPAPMPMPMPQVHAIAPVGPITTIGENGVAGFYVGGGTSKYETQTEELGTRDFEGVSAEGTRRTTTIPAGAIGNDRAIEIVYERWFSKELGLVVYSKNSDPRFGEQTYRLANLVRAEPDPALFSVPTEYRKVSPKASTVYRPTAQTPSKHDKDRQ